MTQMKQHRSLGATELIVSPLGVGTNKWGGRGGQNNEAVFEAFQASLNAGINFFDTAEVYTWGNSERTLGECMKRANRVVITASKFAPLPNRLSPHTLMDALDASLSRLGLETLDLYYVHWPYTLLNLDALMDMMALAVHAGKIRAVGVSNYSARQMRRAAARLARYGIPLAANEVHYSLLHRKPETNGVLDACRELNVALVAYRPLESGKLRESTLPDNTQIPAKRSLSTLVPSVLRKAEHARLAVIQETLSTIAQRYEMTTSQVALRWLLQRDEHIIPIPGATSAPHATENAEALKWYMSDEEFNAIDRVTQPQKSHKGFPIPIGSGH
ncbi:MAG: aldo/keto reductase [Ktedonobacteraceae bacterium]|nr:aldo/keto reductase [Ktedonobacteraceae bacterium]